MRALLLMIVFCSVGLIHAQNELKQTQADDITVIEDLLYLATSHQTISLEQSLKFSHKAIEESTRIANDSLLGQSYKSAGIAQYYLGNYINAITMYDSAMHYFKKNKNLRETANVYNNKGIAYSEMGLHLQAIEQYLYAEEIYTSIQQNSSISNINNNIGTLYFELGAYPIAFEYFMKALKVAKEANSKKSMLPILNNLGSVFKETGQNDSAMHYYKGSRQLSVELGDQIGYADACTNLGNLFLDRQETDSALSAFQKAHLVYQSFDRNLGRTSLGLARVEKLKGNLTDAHAYLSVALSEAEQQKDNELGLEVLHELALIEEKRGNTATELSILKSILKKNEYLQRQFDSTAINSLQARFQVEQKKMEIEALNKEKASQQALLLAEREITQRNRLLTIISLIAMIVSLSFLATYLRMLRKIKAANIELNQRVKMHEATQEELAKSNSILSEKEEILRTLINATPDIICFKDGKGRWLQANNAMLELVDLTEKKFRHLTDAELAELSPNFAQTFESWLVSDEICWQKQRLTRNDEPLTDMHGNKRFFDVLRIPLFKADESRNGIIFLAREVTARKEQETQLKNALAKAEEAEKLKSAFLTNISHEFRTPLNIILGFSELLKEKKLLPEKEETYLTKITESGNTLLAMMEDILDLSIMEAGKLKLNHEAVEIESLIQSVVENCHSLARRKNKEHLAIFKNTPGEKQFVITDARRLKQILTNLTDNALKYTEEGNIEIGFTVEHVNEIEMMKFYVRDSGIGIDPGRQKLLFKRFMKIEHANRKVYPGTGLGLNIVQELTQLLKGEVRVKSAPDEGTTVEILLPYEPIPEIQNLKPTASLRDSINRKHILVVEDVNASYELLRVILEGSGAIVSRAQSGELAIEICNQYKHFDLILMDVQLPGIDGLEATRQIKKLHPGIPIIAQTAFAMHNDREACFEAGCDGYIAKPIKAQLLLPVIEQFFS